MVAMLRAVRSSGFLTLAVTLFAFSASGQPGSQSVLKGLSSGSGGGVTPAAAQFFGTNFEDTGANDCGGDGYQNTNDDSYAITGGTPNCSYSYTGEPIFEGESLRYSGRTGAQYVAWDSAFTAPSSTFYCDGIFDNSGAWGSNNTMNHFVQFTNAGTPTGMSMRFMNISGIFLLNVTPSVGSATFNGFSTVNPVYVRLTVNPATDQITLDADYTTIGGAGHATFTATGTGAPVTIDGIDLGDPSGPSGTAPNSGSTNLHIDKFACCDDTPVVGTHCGEQ
jgi:hypothetical protein